MAYVPDLSIPGSQTTISVSLVLLPFFFTSFFFLLHLLLFPPPPISVSISLLHSLLFYFAPREIPTLW